MQTNQTAASNQIRLYIDRVVAHPEILAGWMAQYTGPHAAEIIALFGTDTLPLPFLETTPASLVIDTVKRSAEAGVEVVLRDWVEVGTRPYVEQADSKQLAWIKACLANDEAASDEELAEYFVENGVGEAAAKAYVAQRDEFLRNPTAQAEGMWTIWTAYELRTEAEEVK